MKPAEAGSNPPRHTTVRSYTGQYARLSTGKSGFDPRTDRQKNMRNIENGWHGNKGSLKRHGKTCSKTGEPHVFELRSSKLYVFTHGILDSRADYFYCKSCGRKDVRWQSVRKK